MKREKLSQNQMGAGPARWSTLLTIAAVALLAGSASGALTSVTPNNNFGDPFGGEEFLKDFDGDLPIVGDDGTPTDGGYDYRAHSDVPDLPDGDGESQENVLYIGGDYPEPSWYPEDSNLDFESAFAPSSGFEDHIAPSLVTPSPVPSPGGIGVLGVLATVVAARRRR